MMKNVEIKRVQPEDAAILRDFSLKTFFEAFSSEIEPADVADYEQLFSEKQTLLELSNPDSEFYFALINGDIAAYLKLNFSEAQTVHKNAKAIEIERIYVPVIYQRQNIGKRLLDFAAEKTAQLGLEYVWLSVWEHNNKAIGFYERNGFEIFGSHEFAIGINQQKELLMRKTLK